MGTLAEWLGSSIERTISANTALTRKVLVHHIEASAGSLKVTLADAQTIQLGGPIAVVVNKGAINSFDVADSAGTVLYTLAPDEGITMLLTNNSTAAGQWYGQVESTASVPVPTSNVFFFTLCGLETGIQKDAWKYEHVGDTWALQNLSAQAHISAVGAAAAGRAYLLGSNTATPAVGLENEEYDPNGSGGTWTSKTDCLRHGITRCGAAQNDLIEVYGFENSPGNQHDQYDRGGDSWATGTAFPAVVKHAVAEPVASGKIYIYGGTTGTGGTWTANSDNREHDPTGDSYTSKTGLPTDNRGLHGSFVLNDKPFAVCGRISSGGTILDRVDEYDTVGDSWTTRQAYTHGTVTEGPGAATRSNVAYAVGGGGNISIASYIVDTWTGGLTDHGEGGTNLRGFQNSSAALPGV